MKKLCKKSCAFLLALLVALMVIPIGGMSAVAASSGEFEYWVLPDRKSCELAKYNGSATKLTIPSELDGYVVTRIDGFAFYSCTSLEQVVIPDSVLSVEENAFFYCSSLTKVTIGKSVESISDSTFYMCTALKEIVVDANNLNYSSESGMLFTKDKTILKYCPSGKSDICRISESVVMIEDSAFFDHPTSITGIDVAPDNKHYSSESGALFNKDKTELVMCLRSKSGNYTIPSSVVRIGNHSFYCCSSLVSITIPNSVREIGYQAFLGCISLKNIVIPDSVIYLDKAFYFCNNLTRITIGRGVKQVENGTFFECISLKDVIILNSTTEVCADAFYPDKMTIQTVYGYADSSAETWATESGYTFIYLKDFEDPESNIIVNGNFEHVPAEISLSVEKLEESKNKDVYSILLVQNDEKMRPYSEATVKIPVPATMDGADCKVYRQEADGTYTDMQAVYQDGYMVFTTDGFGIYVLTTKDPNIPAVALGDLNGDGVINTIDARWALQAASGVRSLSDEQLAAADVNKDGIVNTVDARWILQAASGVRVL